MDNSFEVLSSTDDVKEFVESSIKTATEVIEHYDFVINDLSGNISNVKLEKAKVPVIAFLNDMKSEWLNFRDFLNQKLAAIEKGDKL